MKILFICNQNMHRSKTAEEQFSSKFETKSAGLYNDPPVSKEQITWADVILVMEEEQRLEISKRFPKLYLQKQIINLNIPDIYGYNQPKLREVLELHMDNYFIHA